MGIACYTLKSSLFMNENIFDCKTAAEFLGITCKQPERAIIRMVHAGRIRGLLLSRKQGYRFHRKALEDALLVGGKR